MAHPHTTSPHRARGRQSIGETQVEAQHLSKKNRGRHVSRGTSPEARCLGCCQAKAGLLPGQEWGAQLATGCCSHLTNWQQHWRHSIGAACPANRPATRQQTQAQLTAPDRQARPGQAGSGDTACSHLSRMGGTACQQRTQQQARNSTAPATGRPGS
jgi:hypothetical protein